MKQIPVNIALIAISFLASLGCKQTYDPPAIAHPPDYLVVEGFIETNGTDPTNFTLTHTVKLDSNAFVPEPGAVVTIEASNNASYTLQDVGNGTYSAPLFALDTTMTYRLHIITAAGKIYASDYVHLVNNPPIDSINWVKLDNNVNKGVQIYANTHDPQNNTHYYRWQYAEVWEFLSAFEESVVYVPGVGIEGATNLNNHVCWHYNNSTNIILASTTQLARDLVYEAPIVFIPDGGQQLSVRYSIQVTQNTLTKEAFNWWQVLQKNTEQIGSIFGVQPSANPGNIHCLTDTAEQVLGYVSGGNTRSQRIFITHDQVAPWVYETGCVDMVTKGDFANLFTEGYLPTYTVFSTGEIHYSTAKCVDCTLTGTNLQPSFW